jgi:DNA-directed RNA polymerase specialized sigma24 family protein
VVAVFEKLSSRDFRTLSRYAGMAARPSFEGWIRRVVRSCAIDYLRRHPEYRRTETGEATNDRWVSLATLTSAAGVPADSAAAKRREVLDALAKTVAAVAAADTEGAADLARQWRIAPVHTQRVAERGDRMVEVVELLFQGHRHGAIADQLGLSRREVELAIQHVEQLLTARWKEREPS